MERRSPGRSVLCPGGATGTTTVTVSDGTFSASDFFDVYVPPEQGFVRWTFLTGGDVDSSPAIGSDGTIYVGSRDNYLYALYSDSTGLACSAWPMFHRSPKHTGRGTGIPAISKIPAQKTTMNRAKTVGFTVSDVDTALNKLVLSANSSNQELVAKSKIGFSGKGKKRKVIITPSKNKTGTTKITITVNDGISSASSSFKLTVTRKRTYTEF